MSGGRSISPRRFPGALAPFTLVQDAWADEKGRAEFLGGLGIDMGVSVMEGYLSGAEDWEDLGYMTAYLLTEQLPGLRRSQACQDRQGLASLGAWLMATFRLALVGPCRLRQTVPPRASGVARFGPAPANTRAASNISYGLLERASTSRSVRCAALHCPPVPPEQPG